MNAVWKSSDLAEKYAMGIAERKNRHRQLLRQEILNAARDMFVRDGYEGVTMRQIAQKIEYSPTTI